MSFKNALKNLVAHFSIVWSLLLYIVIFAAVIIGLSLPFIMPIADAFADAGVFVSISSSFRVLFNGGGWDGLWNGLYGAYYSVRDVFASNSRVASLMMGFAISILVVLFRFFLGLYEIPLTTVIDGHMSANCKYGFGGKFFSTLSVSVRYSFIKMLYTTFFDSVIVLVLYGIGKGMGMSFGLPFVVTLVLLLLGSLRFSLVSSFAPIVASGECGIMVGFARSCKICFKHIGSIYSTYFISFLLLLAVGTLIILLTFGVGAIFVLPFGACYVSYLNVTQYYNKSGKRYYVDSAVFTPPYDNTL
ncbi:MAG: hypothetical protein J1G04_02660 [Clostridiales bacterium]|nr:hypothetical protein [Clostridiales bacterium]